MNDYDEMRETAELEDFENFSFLQGYFLESEALYFAAELAMKDRMEGLSEKDFLLKRMELNDPPQFLNWGIAIATYAHFLHRIHSIHHRSLH